MVAHDFICDDKEKRLIYNLVFSKKTCQIITLFAPPLFNIYSGMYIILPDDIYAYWERTRSPDPEPKPSPDPYRQSVYQWDLDEIANQWHPEDHPQYTGEDHLIHGHRPT